MHNSITRPPPRTTSPVHRTEPEPVPAPRPQPAESKRGAADALDPLLAELPPRKLFVKRWEASKKEEPVAIASNMAPQPIARLPERPLPVSCADDDAAPIPDARPARRRKRGGAVGALRSLLATAKANQREHPGLVPLDARQIQQCARDHKLGAHDLDRKILRSGELSLEGRSTVHRWEVKKDGATYNPVDKKILEELQDLVRNSGVKLTDGFITDFARERKLSIQVLRGCIKKDGELKRPVSGQKYARFTAKVLKEILGELARGTTLEKACEKRNLSYRYATHLVKSASGTLTPQGQNMMDLAELGRKGTARHRVVTVEAAIELMGKARKRARKRGTTSGGPWLRSRNSCKRPKRSCATTPAARRSTWSGSSNVPRLTGSRRLRWIGRSSSGEVCFWRGTPRCSRRN